MKTNSIRMGRRTLAMILCVLMVFSTMLVGTITVNAARNTTIYFAYSGSYDVWPENWGGDENGYWYKADAVSGTKFNGVQVYSCKVNDNSTGMNLHFKSGNDTKANISNIINGSSVSNYTNKIYVVNSSVNGGEWKTYTPDGQSGGTTTTWKIMGHDFGNSWGVGKGEALTKDTASDYYYIEKTSLSGTDHYFRFTDGSKEYGPAWDQTGSDNQKHGENTYITADGVKWSTNTDVTNYGTKTSFKYVGTSTNIKIWLDTTNKKVWIEDKQPATQSTTATTSQTASTSASSSQQGGSQTGSDGSSIDPSLPEITPNGSFDTNAIKVDGSANFTPAIKKGYASIAGLATIKCFLYVEGIATPFETESLPPAADGKKMTFNTITVSGLGVGEHAVTFVARGYNAANEVIANGSQPLTLTVSEGDPKCNVTVRTTATSPFRTVADNGVLPLTMRKNDQVTITAYSKKGNELAGDFTEGCATSYQYDFYYYTTDKNNATKIATYVDSAPGTHGANKTEYSYTWTNTLNAGTQVHLYATITAMLDGNPISDPCASEKGDIDGKVVADTPMTPSWAEEKVYFHTVADNDTDAEAWTAVEVVSDKDATTPTIGSYSKASAFRVFLPVKAKNSDGTYTIYNDRASSVTIGSTSIPSKTVKNVKISSSTTTLDSKTLTIYTSKAEETVFISTNELSTDAVNGTLDAKGNLVSNNSAAIMRAVGFFENSVKSDSAITAPQITLVNGKDGSIDFSGIGKNFKGRGNSTWKANKKSYNFNTNDKVSVGGMPVGKKYSLLGNFQDGSLSRNRFLYDLADSVGMPFATDSRYADLYINGLYIGSYLLTQKYDAIVDDVISAKASYDKTTGQLQDMDFLIELAYDDDDDFVVNVGSHANLVLTLPELVQKKEGQDKGDDDDKQIENYVKSKYMKMYNLLHNKNTTKEQLEAVMDIDSVAKMYLINELGKNWDAGVSSFYLHYIAAEDKFYASPVWDYDLTLGNVGNSSRNTAGWWLKNCPDNENLRMDTNFMRNAANHPVIMEAAKKAWFGTSKADTKSFIYNIRNFNEGTDTNPTLGENTGLLTKAYLLSVASDTAHNNYQKWSIVDDNSFVVPHTSLKYFKFDNGATYDTFLNAINYTDYTLNGTFSISSTDKTYSNTGSSFTSHFNFAADYLVSRALWLSVNLLQPSKETATIFITDNWVNGIKSVYVFGSSVKNSTGWEDTTSFALTSKGPNGDGHTVYSVEIPTDANFIIRYNDGRQTVDLPQNDGGSSFTVADGLGLYCAKESGNIVVGTWDASAYLPQTPSTSPSSKPTDPSESSSSTGGSTITLYAKCTQSWWTSDSAAIGIHYWGGSSESKWPGVRGTKVTGQDGMWSFTIPADSTKVIFTRLNGSGDISFWNSKTENLDIPTNGDNLYTVTSTSSQWDSDGKKVTGSWSKYTGTPEPSESTNPSGSESSDPTNPSTPDDDPLPQTVTPVADGYIRLFITDNNKLNGIKLVYVHGSKIKNSVARGDKSDFDDDQSFPVTKLGTNKYGEDVYWCDVPGDADNVVVRFNKINSEDNKNYRTHNLPADNEKEITLTNGLGIYLKDLSTKSGNSQKRYNVGTWDATKYLPVETGEKIYENVKYVVDGDTIEVVGFVAGATKIEVPEEIGGKTVAAVAEDAFKNCTTVTEVVLPVTIKEVGANAFNGCTNLTTLELAPYITSLGANAFTGCSKLKNLYIPRSVKEIGENCFDSSMTINAHSTSYAHEFCATAYASIYTDVTDKLGDFNGDNSVNVRDITSIQKFIAGVKSVNASYKQIDLCNVVTEENNVLGVRDVSLIQQFMVNMIPSL